LFSWTEAAPQGVKLCVSSREYNVFVNFFPSHKRLRLQDLTAADMRHYVRDKLRVLEPEGLDRLADTITVKSNGIFLWVALVVKSIRARLEDGFGLSMIEEEIDSLPEELEGLFQHLMDSIHKSYRKRAYQTFAIVELLRLGLDPCGYRVDLSLLGHNFLDEYNADQEFAQKPHSLFAKISPTTIKQLEEVAQKKLNAQCQGLVETDHKNYITYTHRSVPEFLERYLPRTDSTILAGFEPAHAISQLVLAEIRLRPGDPCWMPTTVDGYPPSCPRINEVLQGIMSLRDRNALDHPPFTFVEALYRAASLAVPLETERPTFDRQRQCNPMLYRPLLYSEPASTLHAATCCGIQGYVDWKLSAEPGLLGDHEKISTLAALAVMSSVRQGGARHASRDPFLILGVLLRRGLSPQTVIFKDSTIIQAADGMNLWEFLIFIKLWLTISHLRSLHRWNALLGQTIQQALEHGANTELSIEILPGESNQDPINHVFGDLKSLTKYYNRSTSDTNTIERPSGPKKKRPRPQSCRSSQENMDSRKLEASGGQ
jgi:hypothetical protein